MMEGDVLFPLLDRLCPLHFVLGVDGRILHAGPTLKRVLGRGVLEGCNLFDVMDVTRPQGIQQAGDLAGHAGRKLRFVIRTDARTELTGAVHSLGPDGPAIVDLSFGIGLVEAVRAHGLTAADFAATDPSIEMLYLVEAKSAAMDLSRRLNLRLEQARRKAEERALSDPLTGLANRGGFEAALAALIATDAGFALMHIDLDHFKAVNDTHGHAAGDAVLLSVAAAMRAETRRSDVVARVGGDEFVILLDGLLDRAALEGIGRRLIAAIEKPVPFGEARLCVSCSIGTVLSDDYIRPEPERMLADADCALYAAKSAGRATHRFHRDALGTGETGQAVADRG